MPIYLSMTVCAFHDWFGFCRYAIIKSRHIFPNLANALKYVERRYGYVFEVPAERNIQHLSEDDAEYEEGDAFDSAKTSPRNMNMPMTLNNEGGSGRSSRTTSDVGVGTSDHEGEADEEVALPAPSDAARKKAE